MVLYTPKLVLGSGLACVRTLDAKQGSLHLEPCFGEWPDGPRTGCNGSLHPKPCFDEWRDGPLTGCKVLYTPEPCFDEWP